MSKLEGAMRKAPKRVSIVGTFRNEADNLPELLRRLEASLPNFNVEVILVDDSSDDESGLKIASFSRRKGFVIRHVLTSRRFGVAPCIVEGFNRANGEVIVYLDCDLQDPPELIPAMIDAWQGGADVVHTRRRTRAGETKTKLFVTSIAYKIIGLFNEFEAKNIGDFKLLDRKIVEIICAMDEVDPYLRGLSLWVGFNQMIIPYDREARFAGHSKFSLWSSLNPYKEFLRGLTAFGVKPLALVTALNFMFVLILLLASVAVIALKAAGVADQGWSSLAFIPIFIGFITVSTQAILALYIGRIYEQISKRPKIIVREEKIFR